MIEMLPAPDHVVALRFSGELTGPDFDRVAAEIETRLARHERIGVVADLTGFDGVTLQALAKDLRYNLAKLGEWKRFPREAVITDKAWVRAAVHALDPLVPQVEVRTFNPGEQSAALAWAADFGGTH
ncbi:STAS/SEC14 domain-containing protein [Phenylobacterium sp. LjRoot219]|uniref:STAS/SEC14 domain-containing protein n=1 Tax=Phenylobacterium sp. LjRoot219 TaxID=3342283 RepID=UPI003ECE68B4